VGAETLDPDGFRRLLGHGNSSEGYATASDLRQRGLGSGAV
jgi:hypothetical protein